MLYYDAHCLRQGEGSAISLQHSNIQTGQLSSRTLLHKRYVIMRTIGQGGMAAVYQAKDMRRDTLCAIKEMSLSSVSVHERGQAIQNFLAEATILSRLNHPNLPAFTDFFSEGARHFLVMEYIEGHTLEELLERNGAPFSERRVLGWARQLCDVLEYLHSQQPPIIFRDLKPGNMMLRHDGRIKLIDFGIARIFRRSGTHDTQMLGTPGFAPPEQYGTAQTDVRSDIYSLAMSLFQLMTNTLVEEGFGLPSVRSINPAISSLVAHVLERATDPDPENRYESIAVFQRALLGEGIFVFERGNPATTPEELAELCTRYPEEAADYLLAGEIESWLHDIGAPDLARVTKRIRVTTGDPQVGVERFVQAVMGPNTSSRGRSTGGRLTGSQISRVGGPSALPTLNIEVRPDRLDFGQVNPGISSPMLLYITGNKGTSVRGTIQPVEPWIIVDTQSFDGMSTLVRVRVDSTDLQMVSHSLSNISQPVSTHYEGSILVQSTNELDEYHIAVVVDVLSLDTSGGYEAVTASKQSRSMVALPPLLPVPVSASGPSRTSEEDEEEDEVEDGAPVGKSVVLIPRRNTVTGLSYQNPKYSHYRAKYGKPGGWNPAQASDQQPLWLKRSLTFASAFMCASFSYMFLAHVPSLSQTPFLPPNHGFIAVLLGMIVLATLGALLADQASTRRKWDTLNRLCTGLGITLSTLGPGELAWRILIGENAPVLHLCTMLILTAIAATIGTNPMVSQRIMEYGSKAMKYLRLLMIAVAVFVGGSLGVMLTMDTTSGWLSPFAILLGIAVMLTLVMRVDRLVKHP